MKTGRQSDISVNKMPLLVLIGRFLVNMLSISDAECAVILVGLLMSGKKQ